METLMLCHWNVVVGCCHHYGQHQVIKSEFKPRPRIKPIVLFFPEPQNLKLSYSYSKQIVPGSVDWSWVSGQERSTGGVLGQSLGRDRSGSLSHESLKICHREWAGIWWASKGGGEAHLMHIWYVGNYDQIKRILNKVIFAIISLFPRRPSL